MTAAIQAMLQMAGTDFRVTESGGRDCPPGLVLAAPASGSGKTTLTLALLRYFRQMGLEVASAKVGPDYIDSHFHAAASGRRCFNLDIWAMRPALLRALTATMAQGCELVLVEGVMGLFDGAADGSSSTAELARQTGWPVVLVMDVRGQGRSVAAVLHGFATYQPGLQIAGVILNRIGGPSHAATLSEAVQELGIPVLGMVPRDAGLTLPERHLGLVQAQEHAHLETYLDEAAAFIGAYVDAEALIDLARPCCAGGFGACAPEAHQEALAALEPLGQRIALACDDAFTFAYPHLLAGWRSQGAEILPFSPLADSPPCETADAIYLPGGYPELWAGHLASNTTFLEGLRSAAERGTVLWGECGGYMVLGQDLQDSQGHHHAMAGLLPLECSFKRRRLQLGYRAVRLREAGPLGPAGCCFRGHEFHYTEIIREGEAPALFQGQDARGNALGDLGRRIGSVCGSFIHLIDRGPDSVSSCVSSCPDGIDP